MQPSLSVSLRQQRVVASVSRSAGRRCSSSVLSTKTPTTTTMQMQHHRARRSSPSSVVVVKAQVDDQNINSNGNRNKKTVLITGANTGIGLVAAKELASKGYDVILGCRDEAKARDALSAIKEAAAPGVDVDVSVPALLDLASLDSVRDFSNAVLDSGKEIDVLLNNAGIMALPRREVTNEGIERQLGVNHVGHFALTSRLLPLLLETATAATKNEEEESAAAVRVVTVASSAHQFGRIDFTNLNFERGYSAWGAYGQSKLANILFAYELARRVSSSDGGISPRRFTSNALHPGVVRTELARHLFDPSTAGPLAKIAALATAPFLKTPEQGARTSVYLASSADVDGVSGKYYVDCAPAPSSAASRDAEVARKLWEVSKEMVGLDPDAAIAEAASKLKAKAKKEVVVEAA